MVTGLPTTSACVSITCITNARITGIHGPISIENNSNTRMTLGDIPTISCTSIFVLIQSKSQKKFAVGQTTSTVLKVYTKIDTSRIII